MPSFKNNKGFGYLPVLAISALVLSGMYLGYNWYTSQSSTNLNSVTPLEALAPVSNNADENSDVLAAQPPKPVPFNESNKPVRWQFLDTTKGPNNYVMYFTGKDTNKLSALMDKISNQNFVIYYPGTNRPCQPNGVNFFTQQAKANVKKLLEDFYLVTLEFKDQRPNTCLSNNQSPAFFIPGYEQDFVIAPANNPKYKFPAPISVIDPVTNSGPNSRLAAPSNAPAKPYVNMDGLRPENRN